MHLFFSAVAVVVNQAKTRIFFSIPGKTRNVAELMSPAKIMQKYISKMQIFLKAVKMIILDEKKRIFFLIFYSKQRLWVHVRTASLTSE